MSASLEESQFLQTRQFQIEEVCRWYRIQPHKISHLLRSTFSNIEHQSLEFVIDTILPQVKRWEQRAALTLFEDDKYFAEMLVDGLLRGDTSTRIEAYSKMINSSQLSPNEARILENRNPYNGGDIYYTPLNMAPVGQTQEQRIKNSSKERIEANTEKDIDSEIKTIQKAKEEKSKELTEIIESKSTEKDNSLIENLVRNASERIAKAEIRELYKIGDNKEKQESFYNKHNAYIEKTLKPFGVSLELDNLTLKSGVDEEWLEDHIHSLIMEELK